MLLMFQGIVPRTLFMIFIMMMIQIHTQLSTLNTVSAFHPTPTTTANSIIIGNGAGPSASASGTTSLISTPPKRCCSLLITNAKFRLDNEDSFSSNEQDDDDDSFFGSNWNTNNNNRRNNNNSTTTLEMDYTTTPQKQQQKQKQQKQEEEDTNMDYYDYYDDKAYDTSTATTFGAEAVPESQRPANEYLNLISSPLFDWANRPSNGNKQLLTRLVTLYSISYGFICWPISGATFTQDGYIVHQALAANVGSVGLVMVLLIRLYSGWGYVGDRLQSKTIEYEETGWYDGDIEEKTESEKARDLFLYRTDVQPVQERLQRFTLSCGALWIASCIALNLVFQYKPLFNEYDPRMLEKLVYDEKVANVAAEQSFGRPTYCDNRYYRAVANGGQGC